MNASAAPASRWIAPRVEDLETINAIVAAPVLTARTYLALVDGVACSRAP